MLTKRVKGVEYAIREIAAVASEVAKTGKTIYNLNIGDPVQFDFKTPEFFSSALANASKNGKNYYVDSLGVIELRKEISGLLKTRNNLNVNAEDILITSGVTEAIHFIIASLIEDNKELLIPGPSYPLYINYTNFFDGKPVEYELNEAEGWEPNIDDLRKKITDKTQAILICSPNNPTGVLYNEKKVKEIINLAGEHNLFILSDEIYDQITFDKPYVCPASLSKDVPIIGLNGFSKTHLVTGWRLGYLYYHDPNNKLEELKNGIKKLARARLSASSIAQFAAIDILKTPSDHTIQMVRKLRERRDYSYKRIRQIEGLDCVKPNGAFYIFPRLDLEGLKKWKNDKDFAIELLKETGVCTVYGSGFGDYGKGHIRLTILPNEQILEKVYNEIENFIK
ncbi:MAG: aminotransferase class I/II-fold pyridoxal phosphate-dependent enzyme [Candidatus Lokiarchaeota archaeon]|nr:aminotransferase class I/II-fold pyridoxal phosphate-dependent enzyme [Candidatus Lokiarchaeota archaeon]